MASGHGEVPAISVQFQVAAPVVLVRELAGGDEGGAGPGRANLAVRVHGQEHVFRPVVEPAVKRMQHGSYRSTSSDRFKRLQRRLDRLQGDLQSERRRFKQRVDALEERKLELECELRQVVESDEILAEMVD